MKKLLLALTALFVMSASSFALDEIDVNDVSKKIETFYKSGSYIKTIEPDYNLIHYYYKQNIIETGLSPSYIDIFLNNKNESYSSKKIEIIYMSDGNLIIVWKYDE